MEKILTLYPTKLRPTIKSEILSYLQCHESENCYTIDIAWALNQRYEDVRKIMEEMEKEGNIRPISQDF
jgi:predicted transcriptional regulator